MPFIQTKVNVELSDEKTEALKSRYGEAISLIPGKSESGLMVLFEGEKNLFFRGANQTKMAYVEVNVLGHPSVEAYDKLTDALFQILDDELGISSENIYIKYDETDHWCHWHV